MPERNRGSLRGDFLAMGLQIAAVMAIPLLVAAFVGAWLDDRLGTRPWLLVFAILVGIGLAGLGSFVVLRQYWSMSAPPVSEEARRAGRRWQAEIEERERRKETGEEE